MAETARCGRASDWGTLSVFWLSERHLQEGRRQGAPRPPLCTRPGCARARSSASCISPAAGDAEAWHCLILPALDAARTAKDGGRGYARTSGGPEAEPAASSASRELALDARDAAGRRHVAHSSSAHKADLAPARVLGIPDGDRDRAGTTLKRRQNSCVRAAHLGAAILL